MGIGDQFAGLPIENLIGGPLTAAAKAGKDMANVTADFINTVGFDKNGQLRTVAFKYEKRSQNDDGTTNSDEMKVDVPMLAIMPIPNLQVDEVNVLFDMEVKQSEKSETATDLSATATGTLNLGIVKVSISGSVSSHSSNTRSSDNSAKYHVDVRATNHGTPEGLARVLDMMAACISPSLVSSTPKDANGQDLSAASKAKTERVKAIREQIMRLENQISAAQGALDSTLTQFKRTADSQQKAYQLKVTEEMHKLPDEDPKKEIYSSELNQLNMVWNEFMSKLPGDIKGAASVGTADNGTALLPIFVLKSMDNTMKVGAYTAGESYYSAMVNAQNSSLKAQKNVIELENQLLKKKTEYGDAISGRTPAALPGTPSAPSVPGQVR